jgi:hypothetical protein
VLPFLDDDLRQSLSPGRCLARADVSSLLGATVIEARGVAGYDVGNSVPNTLMLTT